MSSKIIFIFVIYSLVSLSKSVDGAVKNQKPWKSNTGCGRYFVKEMLYLFSDEKIDNKVHRAITKLKDESRRNKVAFTAQLAKDETYSDKQILKFTKIITNVGGGLNASDGVFYCSEPGLYYFFVNIQINTKSAYAMIHKNDKFIMYVYTGYNIWNSGSNALILELDQGDRISVKSNGSVRFHPNASHFSGYKLYTY